MWNVLFIQWPLPRARLSANGSLAWPMCVHCTMEGILDGAFWMRHKISLWSAGCYYSCLCLHVDIVFHNVFLLSFCLVFVSSACPVAMAFIHNVSRLPNAFQFNLTMIFVQKNIPMCFACLPLPFLNHFVQMKLKMSEGWEPLAVY